MWRTAPEVLRSARSEGYDSKQADVWSSGVMLYAMLFCCYPFDRREDANDPRAFAKITQRIFTGAPLPCPCSLQNPFHAAAVKDAMGTLPDAKVAVCLLCTQEMQCRLVCELSFAARLAWRDCRKKGPVLQPGLLLFAAATMSDAQA